MKTQVRIAPSLLSADFSALGKAVLEAEAAGADLIHLDVMDGQFVPNLTIGPLVVAAVDSVTDLPLDVHLMIAQPERYLAAFVQAGSDIVYVHPEATIHLDRTLRTIRDLGARAGGVLNPATSEEQLRYVLPLLDAVLVMTVNPGFGGQDFIQAMLPKIRRVRQMLDAAGSEAWLVVDGGVDVDTASGVVAAGADTLVAGSAIFGAPEGVAQAIGNLRRAAV